MEKNYKLCISYDGTRYQGWERQPDTELTIQGKLENVLARLQGVPASEIALIGAGRTDAGVHARGMIANVRLDTSLTEEEIKAYLNRYLPDDISVERLAAASDRFHARYNARAKTYRYTCYFGAEKPVFDRKYVTVLKERPDVARMRAAAAVLTGTHDFAAFCTHPGKNKSTERTLDSVDVRQRGNYYTLTFHGDGFLRNMVRILTGTILEAGCGRLSTDDVQRILLEKDRRKAGPTAPPQGLCLMEVEY